MKILFPWCLFPGASPTVCILLPWLWFSCWLRTYIWHVSQTPTDTFMFSSTNKEELEAKLPMLGLLRGNMPTQCMEIDWIFKGSLKCQIFTLLISEFEHLTSFNWYHVIITLRSISTSLFSLGGPKDLWTLCRVSEGFSRRNPHHENWIQRLKCWKKKKKINGLCLFKTQNAQDSTIFVAKLVSNILTGYIHLYVDEGS